MLEIWLSVSSLVVGYLVLLLFGQWVGYRIESDSRLASGTLFPAALKRQQAEAAFQRLLKRYGDAVMLSDKKSLKDAEEDAKTVVRSLDAIRQMSGLPASRQPQVRALAATFGDLIARSKTTYGP